MHKKTILWVNIFCKTPLDTEAHQKVLQYFFPFQDAIRLTICKSNPKITVIYPTGYAPVAETTLCFFIRSKKELYETLASFIELAIQYSNETHYCKAGSRLTITVPTIKRYHRFYKFGWTLDH